MRLDGQGGPWRAEAVNAWLWSVWLYSKGVKGSLEPGGSVEGPQVLMLLSWIFTGAIT